MDFWNKKLILFLFGVLLVAAPLVSFAVEIPDRPDFGGENFNMVALERLVISVLNIVWVVFIGVAVVSFILAGIYFLLAQGDPAKAADARRFVIWGAVGVAVAILGFSIVAIVDRTLNPPNKGEPQQQP